MLPELATDMQCARLRVCDSDTCILLSCLKVKRKSNVQGDRKCFILYRATILESFFKFYYWYITENRVRNSYRVVFLETGKNVNLSFIELQVSR